MTTKEELLIRFEEEAKRANFSVMEITGFLSNPLLAVKAGMAMGYSMAIDDIKNLEAEAHIRANGGMQSR